MFRPSTGTCILLAPAEAARFVRWRWAPLQHSWDLRMHTLVFSRLAASCAAFSLTALFLGPLPAIGQQPWPAKPITIVNGFPAGAGTDIVLRMFQEPLEKDLGTQLVFEYKPGAGGNVGSEYVAKAPADGYTLMIG